jgi:haloalkane dehalogenase
MPSHGRIDFDPDRTLFPFESKWFESSVGPLHYIDEGSGTPLLLLHGNPMWSFLYRHIVKDLRDSFRCIVPDYPGFGLSARPETGYGYTIAEHASVVGELVDHLDLDGYLFMGQDWGGPIGTKVAVDRADRVGGVILGNTWFWPADDRLFRFFSKFMSSGFMQKRILERNFFVERLVPFAMFKNLSNEEMNHYRAVQPDPAARRGVAEMPKQILAARPLLEELEREVPLKLGSKRALLVWGMKDLAFRPRLIRRVQAAFDDSVVVPLPRAKHYIQEDAPAEIAQAIRDRFS